MANFKTHLSVAAAGSGLLASMFLGAGVVEPKEVIMLSVAGTLGGILPDIDSDVSAPIKIIFTLLAIIFAFMVMFSRASTYSILELWIAWGFSYSVVRYLAFEIFKKFTVHRGIFHSVVAALFFWFLTTTFCYHIFDFSALLSWIIGFFAFFGFVIHLGLDELFSVDFTNRRFKRSFGTALKLVDYHSYKTAVWMISATILVYLMTPNSHSFIDIFSNEQIYHNIFNNFWPKGRWFKM